ncbi:MAG: hypothetical protein Q8R39_01380 [bacterium]|nr:hypothetical protein [bacterium]MDZ4284910.1 hypothetical protein [Patescibacteria group bacterium]
MNAVYNDTPGINTMDAGRSSFFKGVAITHATEQSLRGTQRSGVIPRYALDRLRNPGFVAGMSWLLPATLRSPLRPSARNDAL